jgi:hypothetical protein
MKRMKRLKRELFISAKNLALLAIVIVILCTLGAPIFGLQHWVGLVIGLIIVGALTLWP